MNRRTILFIQLGILFHICSACSDKRSDCHEFGGKSLCANQNQKAWVKENCANYCGLCPSTTQPPIPTLPKTQPPITTPPQTCSDKRSDCHEFGGKSLCANQNQKAWVKENCANYCGVCPSTTQPPIPTLPKTQPPKTTPPQTKCEDKIGNCHEYGGLAICSDPGYTAWVKENCPKYCGLLCTQTPTCSDKRSDCHEFGGKSLCANQNQKAWVKENCPNYRGVCPPVTQPPLPTLPKTQPPKTKPPQTQPPQTTPPQRSSCVDKNASCAKKPQTFCLLNHSFRKRCPKLCKLCGTG